MNLLQTNRTDAEQLVEQLRKEIAKQMTQDEAKRISEQEHTTDASLLQSQSDAMARMAQANSQIVNQLSQQIALKDRQINTLLDRIRWLEQETDAHPETDVESSAADTVSNRSQKPVIELLWQLCYRAGITDAAKVDLSALMSYITGWSDKRIYNLLKGENHVLLERQSNNEVKQLNALLQKLNSAIRLPLVS